MARSSRFPLRNRTARRKSTWVIGPIAADALSAVATPVLWSTGTQALQSGLTIVRFRGQILFSLKTTNQTAGGFVGAVGIGIANENAFNAGIGSVMTPVSDIDWDGWLYHQIFTVLSNTATIADGANAVGVSMRMEIDSKAMRKINEGDILFGAIEANLEAGAATLQVNAMTRFLVKLS